MAAEPTAAEDIAISERLLSFIQNCPTSFHTVSNIRQKLSTAGFVELPESEEWSLEHGKSYCVIRNGSSVIAFHIGSKLQNLSYRIVAAHTDSPTYKVKAQAEVEGSDSYLKLNVEPYGGMIDRTWLDRPLTLAGRLVVLEEGHVASRLVHIDQDLLMIPSLAIHMKRDVNTDGALDKAKDMVPLISAGSMSRGCFLPLLAEAGGVEPEAIEAYDLYLVNRQRPCVWGAAQEFVSSPRLDDLQCVFAGLEAFMGKRSEHAISVLACFDNEEVGSGTMQGALSPFLGDVLKRVSRCLSYSPEAYASALARSFVASADNAQAVHPNYPDLYDVGNRCVLNGGVVIKENAAQRYATDAMSRALFSVVCERAGVPVQTYANRSDMPGGSTIGNFLARNLGIPTVDIGLAQLAMHSSYETAGVRDTGYMIRALSKLYACDMQVQPDGRVYLQD